MSGRSARDEIADQLDDLADQCEQVLMEGIKANDMTAAFLWLLLKGRCKTPIILAERVEAPAHGPHLLVEVPSPNPVPRRN